MEEQTLHGHHPHPPAHPDPPAEPGDPHHPEVPHPPDELPLADFGGREEIRVLSHASSAKAALPWSVCK